MELPIRIDPREPARKGKRMNSTPISMIVWAAEYWETGEKAVSGKSRMTIAAVSRVTSKVFWLREFCASFSNMLAMFAMPGSRKIDRYSFEIVSK